jgi:hypothetical protein
VLAGCGGGAHHRFRFSITIGRIMDDGTISREREAERVIYRLAGSFDRAAAWDLRARIDRDAALEVLLDFSLVRDFSDLAVAVVAHGLIAGAKHVHFRGVRQHQLRIFQYCGVPIPALPTDSDATPAVPFPAFAAAPHV